MTILKTIGFVAACICLFSVSLNKLYSEETVQAPVASLGELLDAIEWVESKGNPLAVGDDGAAVGSYQIHKIYVDDCNRICSMGMGGYTGGFDYDDRLSTKMSRRMARVYLTYYGGTIEEMARKHNGGPRGHKKDATLDYWAKIKARLESK